MVSRSDVKKAWFPVAMIMLGTLAQNAAAQDAIQVEKVFQIIEEPEEREDKKRTDKVGNIEFKVQILGEQDSRVKLPSHWIGLSGSPVDSILKRHLKIDDGILVEFVGEDSPASKAGLQVDDIVISVNGKTVSSIEQLARFVAKTKEDCG
jgi:S1-C subfamily serine protease